MRQQTRESDERSFLTRNTFLTPTGRVTRQPLEEIPRARTRARLGRIPEEDEKENVAPPRGYPNIQGRGLDRTSDSDLKHLADEYDLPDFVCCPWDKVPIQKQITCIVNDDRSTSELHGTHWVCFYCEPNQSKLVYFDPFGKEMDPRLLAKLRKYGKTIIGSETMCQDEKAKSCGYWCIWALSKLHKGETLQHILNPIVDDTLENEEMLEDFFSNNMGGDVHPTSGGDLTPAFFDVSHNQARNNELGTEASQVNKRGHNKTEVAQRVRDEDEI